MAKRTQQLIDNFGRPYLTVNVLAGPFTLSAGGVSTEVVVVRHPREDNGAVRSVIQVRSGARVGRIIAARRKAVLEAGVRLMWETYFERYSEAEMGRRLQSARDLPKTMAEVLKS